jgi:signal transduction histidine kinase
MGIQMLIEALEPRTPADIKLHDKLRSECERAARLLTEIRTFGQASARERVACNLGRLVEEILWMLEPRLITKQVKVEKQLNLDIPPILVDRDRIVQALLNIVNNAFEATPAEGKVTVAVGRDGDATVVKIANTGSFIPPEEQQKIFTLFYTTKRGGSGFGLPQAQRAVADHGGEIEVRSSREQGTEFVLRFPDQATVSDAGQPSIGAPPIAADGFARR